MAKDRPGVAGSAVTLRVASAEPAKALRSRLTNRPLEVRANRHTAQGRRIADLFCSYQKALDDPDDPVALANILAASELKTSAEIMRAKLLAGEAVDPGELVKLENLADRAERRLGLARRRQEKSRVGRRKFAFELPEVGA
jgi:hypothetical protein